jgi:hypothetical protein
MMRIALGLVFLMLAFADQAGAKSCASMKQELARLRVDYHKYVSSSGKGTGEITFEGLAEILDKIVALKAEMRKIDDCPPPPRPKNFPERH